MRAWGVPSQMQPKPKVGDWGWSCFLSPISLIQKSTGQKSKYQVFWHLIRTFFSACWAQRSICRIVGCTNQEPSWTCHNSKLCRFTSLPWPVGRTAWGAHQTLAEHWTTCTGGGAIRNQNEIPRWIEQDFFQVNVSFRFRMRWKTFYCNTSFTALSLIWTLEFAVGFCESQLQGAG